MRAQSVEYLYCICGYGGIGRRARLRIWCHRRAGSSPVIRTRKRSMRSDFSYCVFMCYRITNLLTRQLIAPAMQIGSSFWQRLPYTIRPPCNPSKASGDTGIRLYRMADNIEVTPMNRKENNPRPVSWFCPLCPCLPRPISTQKKVMTS